MKHFIYGLIDPFTHMINYVGQTNNLYNRWKGHLRGDSGLKKSEWIRRLQMAGVEPTLMVLEETNSENVDTREIYWIDLGISQGWPLTNGKNGNQTRIANQILADQKFLEQSLEYAKQNEFVAIWDIAIHLNVGSSCAQRMVDRLMEYGIISTELTPRWGFRVLHNGE